MSTQNVDSDQMPQNDQGLHCLQFIQNNLNTSVGTELDLFKF